MMLRCGLTEPELARLRRAPHDVSMKDQQNMCCPEDYSRQRYICHLLIQLLLRSKAGSNPKDGIFCLLLESAFIAKPVDTSVISKFYGSDVDVDRLQLHVNMYHDLMEQKHI